MIFIVFILLIIVLVIVFFRKKSKNTLINNQGNLPSVSFQNERFNKTNNSFIAPEPIKNGEDKMTKPLNTDIYDSVHFKYQDYNGDITERTVDVISGKRSHEFKGYCHLRKEIRTFHFSRITGNEVVSVLTGEILTPMEWRHKLQGTSVSKQALADEERRNSYLKELEDANNTWLALTMPLPVVEFKNKRFALGGYFKSGNIEDSKEKVLQHGGIIQIVPNGKTDYIVVNPKAGVNQSYKNAIHKLLERQIQPTIISESYWLESLSKMQAENNRQT